MKLVIAVDDAPASGDLVESIMNRQWPEDTQFKLVSVIEPFDQVHDPDDRNWNELLQDVDQRRVNVAKNNCKQIQSRLESKVPTAVVDVEIRHGDARDEIIASAEEWGADKIMIGAKARQICPHNILGSVSRTVAKHAHCSVEIVRPAKRSHKHATPNSAGGTQGL